MLGPTGTLRCFFDTFVERECYNKSGVVLEMRPTPWSYSPGGLTLTSDSRISRSRDGAPAHPHTHRGAVLSVSTELNPSLRCRIQRLASLYIARCVHTHTSPSPFLGWDNRRIVSEAST